MTGLRRNDVGLTFLGRASLRIGRSSLHRCALVRSFLLNIPSDLSEIPPTQVEGLFILSLHGRKAGRSLNPTNASWWFVHTQPTKGLASARPESTYFLLDHAYQG